MVGDLQLAGPALLSLTPKNRSEILYAVQYACVSLAFSWRAREPPSFLALSILGVQLFQRQLIQSSEGTET